MCANNIKNFGYSNASYFMSLLRFLFVFFGIFACFILCSLRVVFHRKIYYRSLAHHYENVLNVTTIRCCCCYCCCCCLDTFGRVCSINNKAISEYLEGRKNVILHIIFSGHSCDTAVFFCLFICLLFVFIGVHIYTLVQMCWRWCFFLSSSPSFKLFCCIK